MSKCFHCQSEAEYTKLMTYDPGNFSTGLGYCDQCYAAVVVTDASGLCANRNHYAVRNVFNGDSPVQLADPRLFFDITLLYDFACGICDNFFYGGGIYLEDAEFNVCRHCADRHCHFHEDSNSCYRNRPVVRVPVGEDDEYRSYSNYTPQVGRETERYLTAPPVGIEFEHAPVRKGKVAGDLYSAILELRNTDVPNVHNMFMSHGDGSIAAYSGYSSREIVTAPASGHLLETAIDMFYEPFKTGGFAPGPEHPSCGFHMHVGSKAIVTIMKIPELQSDDREAAKDMLMMMGRICREFISSGRRGNGYCNGEPSCRDKGNGHTHGTRLVHVFGCVSYPSVAVRSFGTLEYRLWPSSNSLNYTKARAELSQKLTRFFDTTLTEGTGVKIDEEALEALSEIANSCKGGVRTSVPSKLRTLLRLSDPCFKSLVEMHEKFNPYSYGKTTFKFSSNQTNTLLEEDTEANMDCTIPAKAEQIRAFDTTVTINPEDVRGDKLFIGWGKNVPCYPATGDGEQAELITKYAKGEA